MEVTVKLFEETSAPVIGQKVCPYNKPIKVKKIDVLRHYIKDGKDIRVLQDGEYIKGTKFLEELDDDNKGSKEVKTKKVSTQIKDSLDFEDIFSGHWKSQVSNIKEIEDINLLNKAIEYAEEHDVSEAVIDRAKDYKQEVEE